MGQIDTSAGVPDLRERLPRLILLAIWAVATLLLAFHHVMWRDEVRALSIALQGDGVVDMLRGLQGEGHPAIWYLLLRLAHTIVPVPEVLPVVAWAVGAGAMTILALRTPLRLGTIALVMFGGFGLYEYVVSARNYGISMLVMFAIATLYARHRDRGIFIGLLLALLCNTNVHAAFFAAGLLGFWLVELICEEGLRWTRKHGIFALNTGIAAIGALLCLVTIYPPAHDAVIATHPNGITVSTVLEALVSPAEAFVQLLPGQLGRGAAGWALLTLLLLGAVLGLVRAPAAFLAAAVVLVVDQVFILLVYPGDYRHKALFLAYLVTLYWLAAEGRGGAWPARFGDGLGRVARYGGAAFVGLLLLQLPLSIDLLQKGVRGIPQSRVRDLADLLRDQGLSEATLIANADVILEPVPYYAGNPLYLIREARYGNVTRFTRDARIHLDLDDLIEEADKLRGATGKPVVIVMQHQLERGMESKIDREGYGGSFSMPTEQVDRFLARTRRLARLETATSDETYDVYLLSDG